VIIAQCSRLTSMIMPANRSAAVIIVNRRRDHEFVIIAPVLGELCFGRHTIGRQARTVRRQQIGRLGEMCERGETQN